MGFSFVSTETQKCLKGTLLFPGQVLGFFKFMLMLIFSNLGLLKPDHQPEQEQSESPPPESHLLLMDDYSFISVPVKTLTSFIKKTLPVVEYGQFLQRSDAARGCDEEGMECSVCLEGLCRSHFMRELSNCSHVFHQHCLDCWIQEGQITCPICRSMLFPPKSFTYKHLLHHDDD